MDTKKLIGKCPFREGTASRKIYTTLAGSKKPLPVKDVAARSKVSLAKSKTLIAAYMNPFHNAPLRRAGIAVVQTGEGYKLVGCKADPKAHRPERGKSAKKKHARRKPRKRAAKKNAQMQSAAEGSVSPTALPATEVVAGS